MKTAAVKIANDVLSSNDLMTVEKWLPSYL